MQLKKVRAHYRVSEEIEHKDGIEYIDAVDFDWLAEMTEEIMAEYGVYCIIQDFTTHAIFLCTPNDWERAWASCFDEVPTHIDDFRI